MSASGATTSTSILSLFSTPWTTPQLDLALQSSRSWSGPVRTKKDVSALELFQILSGILDESNRILGFGHKSFRPAGVEVPLFSVCCEALEISLAWMSEKAIEVQFDKRKQTRILVHPFDPLRDVFQSTNSRLFALSRRTTTWISQSTHHFFKQMSSMLL